MRSLEQLRLKSNDKKCTKNSVKFLGHMISKEGVRAFVKKTSFLDLPRHTNISEVISFLEVVSYYQRFLKEIFKEVETKLKK